MTFTTVKGYRSPRFFSCASVRSPSRRCSAMAAFPGAGCFLPPALVPRHLTGLSIYRRFSPHRGTLPRSARSRVGGREFRPQDGDVPAKPVAQAEDAGILACRAPVAAARGDPARIPIRPEARPQRTALFPGASDGMLRETRRLLDRIGRRAGWKAGEIRHRIFRHSYAAGGLQTLDRGAAWCAGSMRIWGLFAIALRWWSTGSSSTSNGSATNSFDSGWKQLAA